MLEKAVAGFLLVFHWPAIGFLVLGVLVGLYFGAVPGLSGLVGMAILLPFTFGMDPISAFAFLLGMYAVTTTSDTITAVLMGIPGTAASQATILDGYPMAMRGEATRALGAAFFVSAVGGVLGAIVMALSIPIVRPLILSFASPEFFMMAVVGVTMVGALSGGSIIKGIGAAVLGLLLSTIGYAVQNAIPRYWFGFTFLLDGLPLIPLVLGLFALPELLDLAVRDTTISQVPRDQVNSTIGQGVRDALHHWWLMLRSTAIGVYIGMLPGIGGTIADWVAYGHAVQSARDKSQFGQGDVRGVIAPESANNAMKGGALIPTVAFGIPGSAPMAILLGAFLIQGLTPGPEMLTTKLEVTFSMVATLIVANVLGALLLMVWGHHISKVIFVRGHLLIPAIVLFVFMGSWMAGNDMSDWIVLLLFGAIGTAMKYAGWARPPLVLGFILGPIMENSLSISMRSFGLSFLLRPICIVLMVITVFTLIYTGWTHYRDHRAGKPKRTVGEGTLQSPRIAVPFDALIVVVFVYAIFGALGWPHSVATMPIVAAVPGVLLAAVSLVGDVRHLRAGRDGASFSTVERDFRRAALFMVWLLGLVLATVVAGQLVALPLFVALYLVVWGGYRWLFSAIYAAAGLAFIYLMFDRIIHVVWYPSLLFG